jgi:hypothetical protein
MFVPIILGSDKTTVSVGTGNNEYYPLYLSIGNIHNNVRRAHRNGVVLLGFLAIPKSKPFPLFDYNSSKFWVRSRQRTCRWCTFQEISAPDIPFFTSEDSPISQARNDHSGGCSLSWWALQEGYLWPRRLHCWLSRTSTSCLRCTGLVCKVRILTSIGLYFAS